MKSLQELQNFIDNGHLIYRSHVNVECCIFGFHEGQLQILLVKNKALPMWRLPEGYVRRDETLDHAATRVCAERTGIQNLFLKQFQTYHSSGLTGNADLETISKTMNVENLNINSWLCKEMIEVGYYAITDITTAKPTVDFLIHKSQWFPVHEVTELAKEHQQALQEALIAMRRDLPHYPIGKNLLQKKFTLKDIKTLYETLTGKTLNITNFPNKLIALGIIIKLNEKKAIGGHRSPTYYAFNDTTYEKALSDGVALT